MITPFKYIVSDPDILGGKPIIIGTRISVQLVLEWLASGASLHDLTKEFPHLPAEGIREAILYAARFMDTEVLIEVRVPAA